MTNSRSINRVACQQRLYTRFWNAGKVGEDRRAVKAGFNGGDAPREMRWSMIMMVLCVIAWARRSFRYRSWDPCCWNKGLRLSRSLGSTTEVYFEGRRVIGIANAVSVTCPGPTSCFHGWPRSLSYRIVKSDSSCPYFQKHRIPTSVGQPNKFNPLFTTYAAMSNTENRHQDIIS